MKKLLSAAFMLALLGAPAMAADLPAPYKVPPPPPPVVVFTWTGCYVGGNVGGVWADREFTDRLAGDPFFGTTFARTTGSWLGGAQAGCNYQFAGGFVIGIQGDYEWTGSSSDTNNQTIFFNGLTGNFLTKNLASVTGRFGYAWGYFLGYVKAGAAWERDDFSITFPTPAVASLNGSTRTGWTVGIGGEYALTNWVTGFIEYNYYNFAGSSDNFVCGAVACVAGLGNAFPVDRKEWKSVFKVGLNFLWGPGNAAPVVAQY